MMIILREKKIFRIISVILIVIFFSQQIAFARHEDLRREPNAADWLITLASGFLQGRAVNPEWSVLEIAVYTYLVPRITNEIVNTLHIKNQTIRFLLSLVISTLLSTRFEQAFTKTEQLKQKAEEILKKYDKLLTEDKYKELINEVAKGDNQAIDKLADELAKDPELSKLLSELQVNPQQFKEITKKILSNEAVQKSLSKGVENVTKEIQDIIKKEIDRLFKKEELNKSVAKAPFWKQPWENLKSFFSKFFSGRLSGETTPWQKALQSAQQALIYGLAKESLYQALKKIDPHLAEFLSHEGAILVTYYYGFKQAEKNIKKQLEQQQQSEIKESLINGLEALENLKKEFWEDFKISFLAQGLETLALMSDNDLMKDLGWVFGLGIRTILEPKLDKKMLTEIEARLEARKESIEQEIGELHKQKENIEEISDEKKQEIESKIEVLEALKRYTEHQIKRLTMPLRQRLTEATIAGLLSIWMEKLPDRITGGDFTYVSPFDIYLVSCGLSGFLQGLFVKDNNIFALPEERQDLLSNLGNLSLPLSDYLKPAPEKRLSLALALMDKAVVKATAQAFTLGRAQPKFIYDNQGIPSYWTAEFLPFTPDDLYRRYKFVKLMTIEGKGIEDVFMSQLMNAFHNQAVSNIMDILNGNIQKPYIQTLSRRDNRIRELIRRIEEYPRGKELIEKLIDTQNKEFGKRFLALWLSTNPVFLVGILESSPDTLKIIDEIPKEALGESQELLYNLAQLRREFILDRSAFVQGGAHWFILEDSYEKEGEVVDILQDLLGGRHVLRREKPVLSFESPLERPEFFEPRFPTNFGEPQVASSNRPLISSPEIPTSTNKLEQPQPTIPNNLGDPLTVFPKETPPGPSKPYYTYTWMDKNGDSWAYDNRTGKVYIWDEKEGTWKFVYDKPPKLHNKKISEFKGGIERAIETARKIYVGQENELAQETIKFLSVHPEVLEEGLRIFASLKAKELTGQSSGEEYEKAKQLVVSQIWEKISNNSKLDDKLTPQGQGRLFEAIRKLAKWDGKGKSPFTDPHRTKVFLLEHPDEASEVIKNFINKYPDSTNKIKENAIRLGLTKILPRSLREK